VLQREGAAHEVTLGGGVVTAGRGPENDLVLADADVSWHHAEFWVRGGRAYVRDRGSTNGTFLNGWPVRAALAVGPDDEVRLGSHVRLRVDGVVAAAGTDPGWMVEDLALGVLLPVETALGGPEPDAEGVLLLADLRVPLGESFPFRGRQYRIVRAAEQPVDTARDEAEQWPYRLRVGLDGVSGPEAVLSHRVGSGECRIAAENRAVLFYVLARQALDDQRRRRPPAEAGWCCDDDVITGIWGREGLTMDPNLLHVLVHRVRRELEAAGFDPGFLQKRRRALRIALLDVAIG
jgi:hypothetical protein